MHLFSILILQSQAIWDEKEGAILLVSQEEAFINTKRRTTDEYIPRRASNFKL